MDALNEYSDQFHAPVWMVALRLLAIIVLAWLLAGPLASFLKKRASSESCNLIGPVSFVATIAWLVLFSAGALRHLTFHSKAWDLAIFDQVVWNLANGNGWECSVRGVQDLRGDHFEPILLLFVPFYKILPHVGWLLGFQAAALVGTGLLLWVTYRKKIGEHAAFLFFIAFCLFPPLHWLACADFHPIALAPFFIALAWWGRERGSLLGFIAGIAGLMMCGEEAFIVAGWWGLWEFLVRTPWRKSSADKVKPNPVIGWLGLAVMLICWIGFVWLSMVYIPSHRAEGEGYFYVHRYQYLGDSLGEIVKNFFVKPGLWIPHVFGLRSLALLALYLVPMALLPVIRPKTLALLLPTVLYTLLSVSPEQRSIFHQYTAMWIPFLAIASAEALIIKSNDGQILRRASALLLAGVLGFLMFSPIFGLSAHPEWFSPEEWAGEARGVVMSTDPDAAIAAPSALCPHMSHRRVILLKPETEWEGIEEVLVLPDFPDY